MILVELHGTSYYAGIEQYAYSNNPLLRSSVASKTVHYSGVFVEWDYA
jgi:hypothetical protein